MRISDWSSDVCSSDLFGHRERSFHAHAGPELLRGGCRHVDMRHQRLAGEIGSGQDRLDLGREPGFAGQAADRDLLADPNTLGVARIAEELGVERGWLGRSEEHTSELQALMSISYAVFCLQKKHHM